MEGSRLVHALLTIVNNLESIADVCFKMSKIIDNKNKQKAWFTQKQRDKLFEMFELVEEALNQMLENIRKFDMQKLALAEDIEKQINKKRRAFIDKHLSDMEDSKYHINSGNFYQQLIVYSEKLAIMPSM